MFASFWQAIKSAGEAMRSINVPLAAVLVALLGAACGGRGPAASGPPPPSPWPSSPARVTILSPSNGEVIRHPTVHLRVRLAAATTASPATTPIAPAYLHVYLDHTIVSVTSVSMNEGVIRQAIHHVKPGQHLLRAELVGPNHLPFHPRVTAAVTFIVNR
jgi:hypothetical protein